MEIISNIALISINETLIVQVIGFLIFLFVINRVMFRPLRNVMADRELYIERVTRDITGAKKEVASMTSQIRQQENTIKKEAFALRENLEAKGSQEAKNIFSAAKQEIAANSKKIQQEIEHRISQERQSLEKEAEILAGEIISKILNRRQNL
ncbi:MAG: ATP synthase F0 subunit B [Desulfobacterales bacterium]